MTEPQDTVPEESDLQDTALEVPGAVLEAGEMEKAEKLSSDSDKKKALSLKIYRSIVKTILPRLQEVLTKKVS